MALRALETRVGFTLRGLQVGVDELNEAIEVLDGDGLVLLVEIVDVAVEDLDEELNGDGGVHAGVGDAEGTLEAFEDSFAIAVELGVGVRFQILKGEGRLTFLGSSSPRCGFSTTHHKWLAKYTARHWSGFLRSLLPWRAALVISVS